MTRWTDVFRDTERELAASLANDAALPRFKAWGHMAKLWFGNPALHYEIWVRPRLRVVELGLHFEADDLTNARLLAAFRARAKAVRRALGPGARIEDWDKGWARIWEPISLDLPDADVRDRVLTRFAAYVRGLEPMLREELPADVAWKVTAGPPARRSPARVTSSRTSRSGRR